MNGTPPREAPARPARPKQCPHCGTSFFNQAKPAAVGKHRGLDAWMTHQNCPQCGGLIVDLLWLVPREREAGIPFLSMFALPVPKKRTLQLFPPHSIGKPCPAGVPPELQQDYEEAARVLVISPRASAALARRAAQTTLQSLGIQKDKLQRQIDAFRALPGVPSVLGDALHVLRDFGNFGAHPEHDAATGEIIDVEDGEAEALLGIVLLLFDHVFSTPRRVQELKDAIAEKKARRSKGPPPATGSQTP